MAISRIRGLAAILSVIAGVDEEDSATYNQPSSIPNYTNALNRDGLAGKRIGVPRLLFREDVAPIPSSIMAAFEGALLAMRALGAVVVDPANLPSTDELIGSKKEGKMFAADMKTGLKAYFDSLAEIPSGVRTMADLVKFNDDHPELEGGVGQRTLINAEASDGFSDEDRAYLREIGGTRGIDATLKEHNLDALVFPVAGLADTIGAAAVAGYPIITVPLGFLPDDTTAKLQDSTLYYPAPGLPYGVAYTGAAWSEFQLIEIAYAYEQETKTRLKRLAYPEAVPRTQLRDAMNG
ncbi:amidase signature enzyme [Cylindrobasidium torrendii FP15055 ss-10]|uniref:Amidase signature enzyme n=1 Tax=Cylindrobasidium torrendii FP15055 ss-10 TaxID=1314674 RepID=A0A0D7AUR4_9AGAR|nr:amidase signature enzyme [Cylindrobasidium torrendii FP15055 ss-10]